MASMFDYDDSVNLAYKAKEAGKSLVNAKHDLLNQTGDFLFLAHTDREFALRCQMVERDIEKVAFRRLASVSDSKAKLVHAAYDEWKLRHASCEMCKVAGPEIDYSNSKEPKGPQRDILNVKPVNPHDGLIFEKPKSPDCTQCGNPTLHTGKTICSGCEAKTNKKPMQPHTTSPTKFDETSIYHNQDFPHGSGPTN